MILILHCCTQIITKNIHKLYLLKKKIISIMPGKSCMSVHVYSHMGGQRCRHISIQIHLDHTDRIDINATYLTKVK